MATLPHCPYPSNFPNRGLELLPKSKSKICRRRSERDGRHAIADFIGARLSFCLVAQDGERCAPGCGRGYFLAHSLAECGSIWHLSLAKRINRRIVGRGSDWISHPDPLQ